MATRNSLEIRKEVAESGGLLRSQNNSGLTQQKQVFRTVTSTQPRPSNGNVIQTSVFGQLEKCFFSSPVSW